MWHTVHKPTNRVFRPGHELKEVAQSKMADVIKIYADDDPPKKKPLPGQPEVKEPKYPWLKKEDFALMELTGEEVKAMDQERKSMLTNCVASAASCAAVDDCFDG